MSGERWTKPRKPSQRLIEHLHRTDKADAGVTFAVNLDTSNFGATGRRFTPLVTIPRSELSQWFPELVEWLAEDSYFSINSYWIARDKHTKRLARTSPHPEFAHLPYPAQDERLTTNLNACYVDIDIYNVPGLDFGTAAGALMSLADSGKIPHPSIYLNSGRGLWALWLLRDNRNPNESPPAFPSLKGLYKRINKTLNARLGKIGADTQATDAARFLRVPGSVNTKGPSKVSYLLAANPEGKPFTYTLEELADFFQLPRPRITEATRDLADGDPSAKLKGQQGSLGRWTRELQRFIRLRQLRAENPPAFPKGQRSRALRFYAGLLVRVRSGALACERRGGKLTPEQEPLARMTDAEIRNAVRLLLLECATDAADPITSSDANSAVRAALAAGGIGGELNPTHQTIANWFRITPEEAAQLPRSNHGPFPFWEGADTSRHLPEFTYTRAEVAEARRALILAYVQGKPEVPTLRAIRDAIAEFDFRATERTIMKDLAALGIPNPRGRPAKRAERERAQAEAAPLFRSEHGSEPGPARGPAPFGTSTDANQATKAT